MKQAALITLFFIPLISFSQIELPVINGEEDWEKVIVTKNPNDVQGLIPMEEIEVRSMKAFGRQSKLRNEAKEKLKRECAKKNISIVLITDDVFSAQPLNNVNIIGTPYKKPED